jgi:hypothetical protein
MASSRTYPSSQRKRIERALHALREAGWIVLKPSAKGQPGFEVSVPLLQMRRRLAPPQSPAL